MEGQNIAKLVASLGFQIEDKQLDTFLFKVQQTVTALKGIREVAASKIQFKIGLDKTEITATKAHIQALGKTPIKLTEMSVGYQALAEIRAQVRSAMGSKLQLSVNVKEAHTELNNWAKRVNDKFKLNIKAQVSKRALAQSLREASKYATDAVGILKLKDPKVKVGIDKEHLKTEIKNALAHIKSEVSIKINLNGGVSGGSGHRVGGASRGSGSLAGGAVMGATAGGVMEGGRALIPGLGGIWGVGQLSKISQDLEAIDSTMLLVTGSTEAAAKQMAFLKSLGRETGQTMRQLAPMYSQIIASTQGTALDGQKAQDVFASFTRYGTVMGLDSEAMNGSFRAITQMIGKQQVYAEELKGQLAERMPTAIKMAADVMYGKKGEDGIFTGGDVAKLMKTMEEGKLSPTELLPKMAEQMRLQIRLGGAYDKVMNSSRVAQGRFNVVFEDTVKAFSAAGFDRTMFNFWYEITEAMQTIEKNVGWLAKAFQVLMVPVIAATRLFAKLIAYLPKLADYLGLTSDNAAALGGIVAALIFPFTRWFTLIALAVTALDDFTTYLTGGSSEFGKWFDQLSPENQAMLQSFGNLILALADALLALGKTIGTGWVEVFKTLGTSALVSGETTNSLTNFANALIKVVEAITAMNNADFSKIKEVGNALGWATSYALTGNEDTWSSMWGENGKTMGGQLQLQRERWTNPTMRNDEALVRRAEIEAERLAGVKASVPSKPTGIFPMVPTIEKTDTRAPVTISIANITMDKVQDPEAFVKQLTDAISLEWPAETY